MATYGVRNVSSMTSGAPGRDASVAATQASATTTAQGQQGHQGQQVNQANQANQGHQQQVAEKKPLMSAKTLIAQCIFNPFSTKFLERYSQLCPDIATARKFYEYQKGLGTKTPDCRIMEYFIHHMKPLYVQLKKRDPRVLESNECEFLRFLEISRKWGGFTASQRDEVWKGLIGCWLIVEVFVQVPVRAMQELETILSNNYHRLQKNEKFEKEQFRTCAQQLLLTLSEKEIEGITNYIWEFVISEDSPILGMLPAIPGLEMVIAQLRTPEGKEMIFDHMTPLVDDIRERSGTDMSVFEDDDGNPSTAGDAAAAAQNNEARKSQMSRVLSHVVDIFSEAIDSHQDSIRDILQDPYGCMGKLISAVILKLTLYRSQKSNVDQQKIREQETAVLFPSIGQHRRRGPQQQGKQ